MLNTKFECPKLNKSCLFLWQKNGLGQGFLSGFNLGNLLRRRAIHLHLDLFQWHFKATKSTPSTNFSLVKYERRGQTISRHRLHFRDFNDNFCSSIWKVFKPTTIICKVAEISSLGCPWFSRYKGESGWCSWTTIEAAKFHGIAQERSVNAELFLGPETDKLGYCCSGTW